MAAKGSLLTIPAVDESRDSSRLPSYENENTRSASPSPIIDVDALVRSDSKLTEQQSSERLEEAEHDNEDGSAVLGDGALALVNMNASRLGRGGNVRLLERAGLLVALERLSARSRLRRDDGGGR